MQYKKSFYNEDSLSCTLESVLLPSFLYDMPPSQILYYAIYLNYTKMSSQSVNLSVYLSIYLSVCLSICLFYLSVCLSIYLSVCLSICLSICLPVQHSNKYKLLGGRVKPVNIQGAACIYVCMYV